MTDLERIKVVLREDVMPLLDDVILEDLLNYSSSFDEAVYKGAVLKSENTSLSVSGMTTNDTSKYFLRIAAMYRPSNTGILGDLP